MQKDPHLTCGNHCYNLVNLPAGYASTCEQDCYFIPHKSIYTSQINLQQETFGLTKQHKVQALALLATRGF